MSRHPLRTLVTLLAAGAAVFTGLLVSPTNARSTAEPVTTTLFTLDVTGCNGCTIRPYWYPDAYGMPDVRWEGPAKTVRNGMVRFTVTREHTMGLAFRIHDPRAVRANGRNIIVLRYNDQRVGRNVTATAARNGKIGWHCYAGTRKALVHLGVTVDRFKSRDYFNGKPGYKIRAYADPTARYWDTGYQVALRSGVMTTAIKESCGR